MKLKELDLELLSEKETQEITGGACTWYPHDGNELIYLASVIYNIGVYAYNAFYGLDNNCSI